MLNVLIKKYSNYQKLTIPAVLLAAVTLIAVFSISRFVILRSWKTVSLTGGLLILLLFLFCLALRFAAGEMQQQSQSGRWLWIIASLAMGGFISTFLPQPLKPLELFPHRLTIQSMKADGQTCSPVELTGIRNDGVFISYSTFTGSGWTRNGSRMFAAAGENRLDWQGFVSSAVISLGGSPDGCTARITADGITTDYSTVSDLPVEIPVHLEFLQPDWVYMLTRLSIWLCAAFMVLFLTASFHYVHVWSGLGDDDHAELRVEKVDIRLVLILTVIALAGYLYFTQPFGLLFEGDSGSYISAGHSLAAGQGYIADNGDDFDWWPPLYPFLIAGGYAQTALDAGLYLRGLHALLFILTATGTFLLLRLLFAGMNRWLHFAFSLALVFSMPILGCYEYILSEAGFLPAVIWSFVFLLFFFRNRSFNTLLVFSLCISASTLFRYIGVIGLLTGAGMLLLFDRDNLAKRFTMSAAFGLYTAFPEILWLVRNYFVTGNLTGLRTRSEISLPVILDQTLQTLTGWFSPHNQFLTALAVSLGFTLSAGLLIRRLIIYKKQPLLTPVYKTQMALLLYAASYCVFFWYSLTRVANSTAGDRFYAPVLVPIITLMLYPVQSLTLPIRKVEHFVKLMLTGLLFFSIAIPSVNHLITLTNSSFDSYQTLSTTAIQDDRLVAYMRQHPLDENIPIVTNCPDCLNYSLHVLNPLYFNDEAYSQPFLKNTTSTFYMILFSNAFLPYGTSLADWGINADTTAIGSTLERISGRVFISTPIESNTDGILISVTPR